MKGFVHGASGVLLCLPVPSVGRHGPMPADSVLAGSCSQWWGLSSGDQTGQLLMVQGEPSQHLSLYPTSHGHFPAVTALLREPVTHVE